MTRMSDCHHGRARAVCWLCTPPVADDPRYVERSRPRAPRKFTDQDALSLPHLLNERAACMREMGYDFGHAKEPPVTVLGASEGGMPEGSALTRAYEDEHD